MELLVVIAVIAILISIAVADYTTAQKKSRDARRANDMKEIQNAWEQYYADNTGNYPSSCSISTNYLPAGFPNDPKTGIPYVSMDSQWFSCTPTLYCFCAGLELSGNLSNSAVNCAGVVSQGYTHGYYCVHNLQ